MRDTKIEPEALLALLSEAINKLNKYSASPAPAPAKVQVSRDWILETLLQANAESDESSLDDAVDLISDRLRTIGVHVIDEPRGEGK